MRERGGFVDVKPGTSGRETGTLFSQINSHEKNQQKRPRIGPAKEIKKNGWANEGGIGRQAEIEKANADKGIDKRGALETHGHPLGGKGAGVWTRKRTKE